VLQLQTAARAHTLLLQTLLLQLLLLLLSR
jgi:hypothetical protein